MKTEFPLTYQLGQTMKLVRFKMMTKFKENNIDLSLEHYVVLHYITKNTASTQKDLANHFLRDKSIVTRQINSLIDLGYVERSQDEGDKRKKKLKLTQTGIELFGFMKKLSAEVSSELLNGITPEELNHFENVISKIQLNTGFMECLSLTEDKNRKIQK
ncbi:MarR family transcriptional regulator [Draconibacterium sp. IB214405]|uniref:MarR family winged helix-turn-helix transcriptional regulator n=1 Tax=Draconibacterium sp. IB214405 TaxID=3097352 RepID=UPI002A0D932F|nr:MarR family transcriptional regulator [Draconibacterium sp. IB214405]MDX8341313.1 MarR family transcriptional regulator [Draconibacterium sp. IB214405]